MFTVLKGYDTEEEVLDFLHKHLEKCSSIENTVQDELGKPNYEEVEQFNSTVKESFPSSKAALLIDMTTWLPKIDKPFVAKLTDYLFTYMQEGMSKGVPQNTMKNVYIRFMTTMKRKWSTLNENDAIYFSGVPDKYDFAILGFLGAVGLDVVINSTGSEYTFEKLLDIAIVEKTGLKTSRIEVELKEPLKKMDVSYLTKNDKSRLESCKTSLQFFDLVNTELEMRKTILGYKTYHLELLGVPSDADYGHLVNEPIIKAQAMNRPCVVLQNGVENPNYDEVQDYTKSGSQGINYVVNVLRESLFFKSLDTSFLSNVSEALNTHILNLTQQRIFKSEAQKENYFKTLFIVVSRYVRVLYASNKLPLLVVWGETKERDEDVISLLSLLPVDILHICAEKSKEYKVVTGVSAVTLGVDNKDIVELPKQQSITKVATVAYEAEKDLDALLYNGDAGVFRAMQFKEIEPIVLSTTIDEVSLLWDEPARLRSGFEAVGNIVKTPTIFAKIDGVLNGDVAKYKKFVSQLMGSSNATVLKNESLMHETQNYLDLMNFAKQICFKDSIDFKRLQSTSFYTYGKYSLETQNLIIQKVEKLIEMQWCCDTSVKGLIYRIIACAFSLPDSLIQKIQSFDFTADVPKLLVINTGDNLCSIDDCIAFMLLKLIGFDIVFIVPTGYRIIEQYISSLLFTSINHGNFVFDMSIDGFMEKVASKKKKFLGLFRQG